MMIRTIKLNKKKMKFQIPYKGVLSMMKKIIIKKATLFYVIIFRDLLAS